MDLTPRFSSESPFRVALVSMPWPLFNRPSVQLGTLKAWLETECDWIKVETFHPYLETAKRLGSEVYHWICRNVWVSEALYSSILFPELLPGTGKLIEKALRNADPAVKKAISGIDGGIGFQSIKPVLKRQLDTLAESVDWSRFDLVGFSVCFNQLLSSLAFSDIIKQSCPNLPVVFGGSFCAPDVGASLLRNFPQIDYVVNGEGEGPLRALCESLALGKDIIGWKIQCRNLDRCAPYGSGEKGCQIKNLDTLPIPDFSGYFSEMQRWFGREPFIPTLPVEFSRGCWWSKCAFCNLNQQWRGYRAKSVDRMVYEVLDLSEKHATLDFTFTDNALPVRGMKDFFKKLSAADRDLSFFAEIHATQRGDLLKECRRGGLKVVQVGIEALSNGLLQRMNKGVSVIENISMMKDAVSAGIELEGNLIIEFPGSSPEEVDETLKNLDFVFPFRPLSTASFFLGHGSPVDTDPAGFGIRAVVHHPRSAKLFPREILKDMVLLIKDYRGDRTVQRKLWEPVCRKVKQWSEFHGERGKSIFLRPPLSYRDGGDFIIIRQELPGKPVLRHRLRGLSRKIYLFCEDICEIGVLEERFSGIGRDRILFFLNDLVEKRIMFSQDEKFLSLAIRTR